MFCFRSSEADHVDDEDLRSGGPLWLRGPFDRAGRAALLTVVLARATVLAGMNPG
jgi:hypothetical protein